MRIYTTVLSWVLLLLAAVLIIVKCINIEDDRNKTSWGLLILAIVWLIITYMNHTKEGD
jgi:uncharacterized membrane protein